MRTIQILLLSTLVLPLAGCGPRVTAPSLMPRPVEKQPIEMPVESSVEAATPADPALTAKIASLIGAADAGDRAFAEQRRLAEAAVARGAGAAQGSDPWVEAQEAVTGLESARATVRDAAAEIDALRDDPVSASPGNRAAIDEAAKRVGAIEADEGRAITALNARLG